MIITILFSLQAIIAQTVRPWPIPSYNIPVLGMALFQENHPASVGNTEGKRRIHIQVSSQKTPDTLAHSATVWVYSLDHATLYGPYTVFVGTTLTVDIDDREWGVMVEADEPLVISVWITLEDTMRAFSIPEN